MNQRLAAAVVLAGTITGGLGLGCDDSKGRGLTQAEDAAIRQQVEEAMQHYIASVNRADLNAALASFADVPEFRFADTQGKLYDLPSAKRMLAETFGTYQSAVHDPPQVSVLVLASDAVHYVWNGSGSYVLTDGTVMLASAFTYSCVFRRLNGEWKIVYFQDSIAPPEPMKADTTRSR